MIESSYRDNILRRLKNVRGHIDGIIKMVEEGKECEEIMLQIAAVKKSLEKIGYYVIESHAVECFYNSQNKDDIKKLLNIMVKFLR